MWLFPTGIGVWLESAVSTWVTCSWSPFSIQSLAKSFLCCPENVQGMFCLPSLFCQVASRLGCTPSHPGKPSRTPSFFQLLTSAPTPVRMQLASWPPCYCCLCLRVSQTAAFSWFFHFPDAILHVSRINFLQVLIILPLFC